MILQPIGFIDILCADVAICHLWDTEELHNDSCNSRNLEREDLKYLKILVNKAWSTCTKQTYLVFTISLHFYLDSTQMLTDQMVIIFCLFLVPNEVKAVQNIKGASFLNESVFMNKLVERMI